jgi:hypothetical protein
MLNRQGVEVVRDTTGYGHVLTGNVSLEPTQPGRHLIDIDTARCVITRNSFAPVDMNITAEDFESVDAEELMAPRQADGSLPEIHFLKARRESPVYQLGLGYED